MPYAFDNGAFAAGAAWTEGGWLAMLDWGKLSGQPPLWALVPDVVGDREGTLRKWDQYAPVLRRYGWPLAFAVQDGMAAADVPREAEVVFIGGSQEWKWATLRMWCDRFAQVHVGGVNTYRNLWKSHEAGAASCDGTGWFRGDQKQRRDLYAYMSESSGHTHREVTMALAGMEA